MMINYIRFGWQKVGAERIPAQTRVASSYGYLQLTFRTAVDRKYPNYDPNTSPEDLNVTDTNLEYALKYQKKLLVSNLGRKKEATGSWKYGLEGTFKRFVWGNWNTRDGYPSEVAGKIGDFEPQ